MLCFAGKVSFTALLERALEEILSGYDCGLVDICPSRRHAGADFVSGPLVFGANVSHLPRPCCYSLNVCFQLQ